jgi:nucleotide-binding universal stress UspA family protein
MYELDFILVPTDGSESADAALDHAVAIASDHDATVHLLYVANTNEPSLVQYDGNVIDVLEQKGETILSDARERAEQRGVPVVDDVVQGDPGPVIVNTAANDIVDLVVMGAHGRRTLGEYILGGVTEHVVNSSESLVLTVRSAEDVTPSYPYGDVLVPTDGSDHAMAALELGAEIANHHDATLQVLTIIDEPTLSVVLESTPTRDQLEEHAREVLEEAETIATNAGVRDVVTMVEFGSIPREIQAVAEAEGINLIVMGTHGRTGLNQHLLGSITERVLRTAPTPVLTTRRNVKTD